MEKWLAQELACNAYPDILQRRVVVHECWCCCSRVVRICGHRIEAQDGRDVGAGHHSRHHTKGPCQTTQAHSHTNTDSECASAFEERCVCTHVCCLSLRSAGTKISGHTMRTTAVEDTVRPLVAGYPFTALPRYVITVLQLAPITSGERAKMLPVRAVAATPTAMHHDR